MIYTCVIRNLRTYQHTPKFRKQLYEQIKRKIIDNQSNPPVSQFLQDPDFMKNYEDIIDIHDANPRGSLTICPTPLGNLLDISVRQFLTLKKCDLIACEDTRVAGKLINLLDEKNISQFMELQFGIEKEEIQRGIEESESIPGLDLGTGDEFLKHTISQIKEQRKKKGRGLLISCFDQNEHLRAPKLIQLMKQGFTCALVVDAGTPTIADSGSSLVQETIKAGIRINSLPGPVAASVALSMSGMPCSTFYFQGYLPKHEQEKLAKLEDLKETQQSCIVYESAKRVAKTLMHLQAVYGSHHQLFVCSELTKMHEQQFRGSIGDLILQIPESLKGEVTMVIAPVKEESQEDYSEIIRISSIIKQSLDTNDTRLAKIVSEITGKSSDKCFKILSSQQIN